MRKYECHITCQIGHDEMVQTLGELFNFKFSRIDGDALLGRRPFCYLTAYDTDAPTLLTRMKTMASMLEHEKVIVLRQKIEEIIYDTKTGVDTLAA